MTSPSSGRGRRPRQAFTRPADVFDAAAANSDRQQKLQHNLLRRRIDDRNDFTLDEVAARLDAAG
jgi:hypothetical protein